MNTSSVELNTKAWTIARWTIDRFLRSSVKKPNVGNYCGIHSKRQVYLCLFSSILQKKGKSVMFFDDLAGYITISIRLISDKNLTKK